MEADFEGGVVEVTVVEEEVIVVEEEVMAAEEEEEATKTNVHSLFYFFCLQLCSLL